MSTLNSTKFHSLPLTPITFTELSLMQPSPIRFHKISMSAPLKLSIHPFTQRAVKQLITTSQQLLFTQSVSKISPSATKLVISSVSTEPSFVCTRTFVNSTLAFIFLVHGLFSQPKTLHLPQLSTVESALLLKSTKLLFLVLSASGLVLISLVTMALLQISTLPLSKQNQRKRTLTLLLKFTAFMN